MANFSYSGGIQSPTDIRHGGTDISGTATSLTSDAMTSHSTLGDVYVSTFIAVKVGGAGTFTADPNYTAIDTLAWGTSNAYKMFMEYRVQQSSIGAAETATATISAAPTEYLWDLTSFALFNTWHRTPGTFFQNPAIL
jgi:hypothetical protein